jgi:hypothetical protein
MRYPSQPAAGPNIDTTGAEEVIYKSIHIYTSGHESYKWPMLHD